MEHVNRIYIRIARNISPQLTEKYLMMKYATYFPFQDVSCCTVIAEKFANKSPEILAGQGFSRLLVLSHPFSTPWVHIWFVYSSVRAILNCVSIIYLMYERTEASNLCSCFLCNTLVHRATGALLILFNWNN